MAGERKTPDREVPVRIIVRKKGHGGGHHGGAWKVAFADFMTSMMALFLVLWLVNQSSDVKSAIAGYFQDPLGRADEFGSSIVPGEGTQAATIRPLTPSDVLNMRKAFLQQVADRLRESFEDVPELASVRDNIEITITEEGLKIELLEDSVGVFFETGRSAPSPRGHEILAVLGRELGTVSQRIRIEGHTDARAYSGRTDYSNWELSADRANAARRIMEQSGVASMRIARILGNADRELRDPADPFSPHNRRVTITLLFENRPAAADTTRRAPSDSSLAVSEP